MSFLSKQGPELLQLGYDIIPIAHGTKMPGNLEGWTRIKADREMLRKWILHYPNGGVGVLTENTPAVDLDIHDVTIVGKMQKFTEELLGKTARRVGKAPKLLMVYRTDTPFRKITSAEYYDELETKHRVEILAHGQQFVAFAEHPDTKRPYEWVSSVPLSQIPPRKLPTITEAQGRQIVDYFESIVPKSWVKKQDLKKLLAGDSQEGKGGVSNNDIGSGPGRSTAPMDVFAHMEPKSNISEAHLVRELKAISSEDYEIWLKVGMGLYHQYDGSDVGLTLWDRWSQESGGDYQADKKHPDHPANKWRSFEMDLSHGRPVTIRSLMALSKREDQFVNVLDKFLERYVLIAEKSLVHDLDGPPHQSNLALGDFRNYESNKFEIVETKKQDKRFKDRESGGENERNESEGGVEQGAHIKTETKKIKTVQAWLEHKDLIKAVGTTYRPKVTNRVGDEAGNLSRERQRLITDEYGRKYVNEFYMPCFPYTDQVDCLDVFFTHMDYLFEKAEERDWMIGWMAFNLQRPEVRCRIVPLHISISHGTGRGWLVRLMSKLLGAWNVTNTKMEQMYAPKGGTVYNEFLDRSLLCTIEEVREGGMRYQVSDHIREILTEPRLNVNVKWGGKKTQDVFTNFFFMSNHPDAIIISAEDRRYNVFKGIHPPRDKGYYDRLYKWLGGGGGEQWSSDEVVSRGVQQLYWMLKRYDLTKFKDDRCFENDARRVLIDNNRSETEELFWDYMRNGTENPEDGPYDYMNVEMVECMLLKMADVADTFGNSISEKQLKKLLQEVGEKETSPRYVPAGPWGERKSRRTFKISNKFVKYSLKELAGNEDQKT
jgi:hypothetical protein